MRDYRHVRYPSPRFNGEFLAEDFMNNNQITVVLLNLIALSTTAIAGVTWLVIVVSECQRRNRDYLFLGLGIASFMVCAYFSVGYIALLLDYPVLLQYFFRPALGFMMTLFTGIGVFASANNEARRTAARLKILSDQQQLEILSYEKRIEEILRIETRLNIQES